MGACLPVCVCSMYVCTGATLQQYLGAVQLRLFSEAASPCRMGNSRPPACASTRY